MIDNLGDIKRINGEIKVLRVGAFTDKNGEYYTKLKWYCPTGAEARAFRRQEENGGK